MNLESQEKDQLYTALAQAQHEFPTIRVNRKAFKNEYADLYAMLKPTFPILKEYGLSIHEHSSFIDGNHVYGVRLAHKSGQYITNIFPFVYDDPKPSDQKTHKIAGAQTYFFRYYVKGILGLVISDDPEDDDGQGSNVDNKTHHTYHELITKDQLDDMQFLLKGYPMIAESLLKGYKILELAQLPKDQYMKVMEGIRARKQEYANAKK